MALYGFQVLINCKTLVNEALFQVRAVSVKYPHILTGTVQMAQDSC